MVVVGLYVGIKEELMKGVKPSTILGFAVRMPTMVCLQLCGLTRGVLYSPSLRSAAAAYLGRLHGRPAHVRPPRGRS